MRTFISASFALLILAAFVRSQEAVKPAEEVVKPIVDDSGWKPIFDGKGHQGFRGLLHNDFLNYGWHIEGDVLTCPKGIKNMGQVTGGNLITSQQYWDFEFNFEWKVAVSGKTGVMYFAAGTPQKPTGFVYQIIDDTHHPDGLKGGPIRRTGALLGIIPPSDETKKLNPPDSWNEGRIVVQGNHVEHWLNGAKVVEFTLGSPEFTKQLAAVGFKPNANFGRKFKTSIVLIDAGEEITFRNLKVRDLTVPPGTTVAPVR